MLDRHALSYFVVAGFVLAQVAGAQCEVDRLTNTGTGALYGAEVALSGARAVLASPVDGAPVKVFERSGTKWLPTASLSGSGRNGTDEFGDAVGVSGNVVMVGAPFHTDADEEPRIGRVYVFEKFGPNWIETASLSPLSAIAQDRFGTDLDLSGARVLVGAPQVNVGPGKVVVYVKQGQHWVEEGELSGSTFHSRFGAAVDLDGSRGLVGAPSGERAFVIAKQGGAWVQVAQLASPPGFFNQGFGSDVALLGKLALVGNTSGTAFLFEERNGQWLQIAQFSGDALNLALGGQRVFVGKDVYELRCEEWVRVARLNDVDRGGYLDEPLAVDGDRVLLGAPFDDSACPPETRDCGAGAGILYSLDFPGCNPRPLLRGTPLTFGTLEGGVQSMELLAGQRYANGLHVLLGGASGTEPGLPLFGTTLPLNLDGYLLFTLTEPGAGLFGGSPGLLDFEGCAELSVQIPALIGLPPLDLNHVELIVDAGFGASFAPAFSNPLNLKVTGSSVVFEEDFESGGIGWVIEDVVSGLWHFAADGECGAITTMAAYNVGEPACNYQAGLINLGNLVSPNFTLTGEPPYALSFTNRASLDAFTNDGLEIYLVRVGPFGLELLADELELENDALFETKILSIPSSWAGSTAYLRFEFLGAPSGNDGLGWQIDDVRVTSTVY